MNYELAKKLKGCGFPQAKGGFYYWNRELMEACDMRPFYDERTVTHTIKIPTLSELIEACGDKFHGIYVAGGDWKAHGFNSSNEFDDVWAYGPTADEAVANLWLELNKKTALFPRTA